MTARLATIDDLRAEVAAILAEDADVIGIDDNLMDFGLDSIRLMSLAQRWADAGVALEFGELAERPQLSHWWSIIEGRRT